MTDLIAIRFQAGSMEVKEYRQSSLWGHRRDYFLRRRSQDGVGDDPTRMEEGDFMRLVNAANREVAGYRSPKETFRRFTCGMCDFKSN